MPFIQFFRFCNNTTTFAVAEAAHTIVQEEPEEQAAMFRAFPAEMGNFIFKAL